MTYWIYRFKDVVLPAYNSEQDIGTANARTAYIDLPSGGRFDQYQSNLRSPLDVKTIKYKTTIGTASSNTSALTTYHNTHTALRKLIGVKDKLYRIRDYDGTQQYTIARCTNVDISRSYPVDRYKLDVSIDFEADNLIWYSLNDVQWYFDEAVPRVFDTTGFTFDAGYDSVVINADSVSFTINASSSDIEIKDPIFTIIPSSGSISNIKVMNNTNGMYWQYLGTVTTGQELKVDLKNQSVTLNGVDAYANFTFGSSQTDWLYFNNTINSCVVTATRTGSSTMIIYWGDEYL